MFAASKTASVSGGYQISRSLRFNSADSTYLNRTPASAGNRQTWTWSAWIKRSGLSTGNTLFGAGASDGAVIRFENDNSLRLYDYNAGFSFDLTTSQVFRDVSAWYHIVLTYDSTQATSSNRTKLYVNGTQVTAFASATYPSLNQNTGWFNNNVVHTLGVLSWTGSNYFSGYMTEVNFVDGQALTPSSFGETNAQTGVWQPKAYSGSYGTNGFYLNFSDNSNTTAATLGKDYSGNGNNWTPNNFSVTAGAGNDSLVDSPTSYGTDTGVGGTVRGNYATFNPLVKLGTVPLVNGNLEATSTANTNSTQSTIAVSSGKWYAEFVASSSAYPRVGVQDITETNANMQGSVTISFGGNNELYVNGSGPNSYGQNYAGGDVIGVAVDADTRKVWFSKNGTWINFTGSGADPATGTNPVGTLAGTNAIAYAVRSETCTITANFGQRPFAYTAPSGFKALCTQNLPTPTIGATTATQAGKYYNAVTYTGTGSSNSVTGVGFQPDWTWIKSRSNGAYHHRLVDAVRGVTKEIYSNLTNAEGTDSNGLTAFGSDGFTLGSSNEYNASGSTFVAWNWKANGSGSTNTSGSITSTVSANTTSGFSVVTYTGTGTTGTIGHGLGVAPSMVIVKCRSTATTNWYTYHISIGNTGALGLNLTDATITSSSFWNNTSPTSSVFTLSGASGELNGSGRTYVAYAFAEVAGYSKFGSYTGNGSADGPFVYCGFRPAYLLVKRSDSTYDWWVFDNKRLGYNATSYRLAPDLSNAEYTTGPILDLTSNGFKIRDTSQGWNGSGGTIIFAAFAESPFKYGLAR